MLEERYIIRMKEIYQEIRSLEAKQLEYQDKIDELGTEVDRLTAELGAIRDRCQHEWVRHRHSMWRQCKVCGRQSSIDLRDYKYVRCDGREEEFIDEEGGHHVS